MSTLSALHCQHLLAGARAKGNAGKYRQQPSVRASSESASLSAMVVEPCSSTKAPRRVSSFIIRVMILCSTACSASSVGAGASTKRSFSED